MKYRTKQLTRLQRWYRKYDSIEKSTCAIYGYKYEKCQPRWRLLRKVRTKRYASMKKRLAYQEIMKIDI